MTTPRQLATSAQATYEYTDRQADALADALRSVNRVNADLEGALGELGRRVEGATNALGAGAKLNPLGVIQGAALDVDRLCAVRDERIQQLVLVLVALGHSHTEALADYYVKALGTS